MRDFETPGGFYLGADVDPASGTRGDAPTMLDAKDLTTHAVIVGMTGSGKTGLGIGLIEEAAIDRVPVIAIDPKGDLGNILLQFPGLTPGEFLPWINAQEAEAAGRTPQAQAEATAGAWRAGLAEWGQDGDRIRRMQDAAEFTIYTPGSTAGRPVSALKAFTAPAVSERDGDAFRERVQATATSALGLVGVDADPLTSREHILLATILDDAWRAGRSPDLAALIGAVQQPPVAKVGVMDIETFFPSKERFALAMRLNGLLAAPGFEAWMSGDPLDAGRFLFTADGRPRVSVFSIAHLSDPERMFFVSMLLGEVVRWMRTQAGTTSLRALLYMDEVAGYLPPVAMPPSKPPMLTLLKQARAYGVGVVLATQNPVDLDYKALSNAGAWFIGRLQTDRDKMKVLEGLEGAGAGAAFDRGAMERTLAGLGKRVFLLHNVHDPAPVTFTTRWTLSYLAGPLTRDQIQRLTSGEAGTGAPAPAAQAPVTPAAAGGAGAAVAAGGAGAAVAASQPPVLPPDIPQYFARAAGVDGTLVPVVAGAADILVSSAKYKVQAGTPTRVILATIPGTGPVAVDWDRARRLTIDLDALDRTPPAGATFAGVPPAVARTGEAAAWMKGFGKHVKTSWRVDLWYCAAFKVASEPGETEGAFRARLQQRAREARDAAVEKLRRSYAPKVAALEERRRRAEAAIARETAQASQRKLDTAVSVGSALFGAFLGRRAVSATSLGRVGTAMRSAGRMRKEADDVGRARDTMEAVRAQLADLERQLESDIAAAGSGYDAAALDLEAVQVRPRAGDIQLQFCGLLWLPPEIAAAAGTE